MRVLVTGGAGFIGSFITDELVNRGHSVRIFDSIEEQVHQNKLPDYLNKQAEFVKGNVKNRDELNAAIKDSDVIFHKAAAVGVGQSMYQIRKYVDDNSLGTAVLLDILANESHSVKKLIVASSMSTYGEGLYNCEECGNFEPGLRGEEQFTKKDWELHCPECNSYMKPIPTPETKHQNLNSVYALTKKDQEDICLMVGKAYGIPTVALRYFNVYGPRQSLSNPYTGVAAIFMSRIKNGNQPFVYEDGMQTRDFINVHDIVQANMLAMESKKANYQVFNVGSGKPVAIKHVAEILAKLYQKDIRPKVTLGFRKGDVRHCYADISKIQKTLGFRPKTSFEEGMKELIEWSKHAEAVDRFDEAFNELKTHGLG